MMFLQIAEIGREYVLQVPVTLERRHEREYWRLRHALSKEDPDYFIRNTSIRVIYVVLKNYLEDLPTPILVNRLSEGAWWINLADDLVLTFVFRSAHTPSIMKPFYADKIKRKLKTLRHSKYTLTMMMVSMLRAITWSQAHKRFRSEQLSSFIDDLRDCFLVVPRNAFPLELDTVVMVVTFMVQHAIPIFGEEIDNYLVGIKRPNVDSSIDTVESSIKSLFSSQDIKKREIAGLRRASTSSLHARTPIIPAYSYRGPYSDSILERRDSIRSSLFTTPLESDRPDSIRPTSSSMPSEKEKRNDTRPPSSTASAENVTRNVTY